MTSQGKRAPLPPAAGAGRRQQAMAEGRQARQAGYSSKGAASPSVQRARLPSLQHRAALAQAKGASASTKKERIFLALAAPMPATADFSVDLNFPPAFMARGIEVTAVKLFGCKDWPGTLQRLTTDSGYKHEEATNIPKSVFAKGSASNPRPGL